MAPRHRHWYEKKTAAHDQASKGIKVVDSILSFVKDGQGAPSTGERNLFMAAVVFTYAVWENYVEQLAIELVGHLSEELAPERVPEAAREDFCKKADAWAIAVSPGWRAIWRDRVSNIAVGDDVSHGINSASKGQITGLFRLVGVDPLSTSSDADIKRIDDLIKLRGQIVHTAQLPTGLQKASTKEWRDFVEGLVAQVDATSRDQARALLV